MKARLNKNIIALAAIFALALGLRLYQLSFFEFKNDQYLAIGFGNATRASHFLITHGMGSGTGLDNPPFFFFLMGALTAFTNDPAQLTFCFFCMNMIALLAAFIYFYRTLPAQYALLSAAFLSFLPAFTIYSNNIWAQCTLPLLVIVFNVCLYKLIKDEHWQNFFYMGLLATVAAQIHGMGFFLLPFLILIAVIYWKKIDKKIIAWTMLAIAISFIPYAIHLFKDKEISNVIAYGLATKRAIEHPWKILPFHLRMASFEFFRSYFRFDFYTILKNIAGPWYLVLYPLTFIPSLFFVIGLIYYLGWLIKGKIFDASEADCPVPFQISGILILIVTLEIFICRTSPSLHYCIVLFPAYSIITGFAAFKIWKFYWGKWMIGLGLLSSVILLTGVLLFIDKAGGHPYEYGVSYKSLLAWQKEIHALQKPGECFDLKANIIGKDITHPESALAVVNQGNGCRPGDEVVPLQLNIEWNDKLMRYEHRLESPPTR